MVRSTPPEATPNGTTTVGGLLFIALGHVVRLLLRVVFQLAKWAVLFPMLSAPALVSIWALLALGWRYALAFALVAALLLVGWRLAGPTSFRRAVTLRIRARWHTWHMYHRRWAAVCALHGLTANLDGAPVIPRLRKAYIGDTVDELLVGIVAGQTLEAWTSNSEALAHAFGAQSATIRLAAPGRIWIVVRRADRLTEPIALPAPVAAVDLEAVPIGVTENGTAWRTRVLGRHLLVAGATGAGKGSVVWSILAALAPLIHRGDIQAWVIDPKGGMEFGGGARLFSRFAYDTGDGALDLLRAATEILTERANRLRGNARQHTPSPDEPLILLVIDELASLTAYQTDRKLAAEMSQLLGLILSQGRAVGVNVAAAVQDPSKDTVALRQLFPTRIGLRLAEASQVDMVLGAGARNAGALCDQIPDRLPGVAYVMEDGISTPLRARAFHVTDADIDAISDRFAPPAEEDD